MNITKVISTSFDTLNRLKVKFLRFGKSDVQECIEASPYGIDSNPIKDMIAIYAPTEQSGNNYIIGYLNKNRLAEIGENRLFSTDENGTLKAWIWLKNDGKIQVLGDSDNFVRYSKLEEAFNELKASHNELAEKWNTFATAYVPGSPATVGTPPTLATSIVQPNTSDISGAKINEVQTL
jgi:hypothetical protein